MKLLLIFLVSACGQFDGVDGQNGSSCTTRNDSVGVFVECSDGTDSFIPFPKNGSDGATGPQGEKGDVGQTGEAGTDGADGLNGTNGVDGVAGADGRDAQVVSMQLCPGDTGAYKEQGFLIDNNLYAVYYDHAKKQSFLAELKTGTYKTTNGSNCQFTYVKTATQVILSNGSGTTTINLN
jgi:hypothetical protein